MNRRTRNVTIRFGAVAIGVAAVLSGCSSDETVDLAGAGVFEREAGACVVLAGNANLRDKKEGVVGTVAIYVNSAEQRRGDNSWYYDVTGRTDVNASGAHIYRWTCVVHVDDSGESLDAKITSFKPADK
ncbi:MAG: hypothetical protein ABJB03_04415 [Rhodoglobus sp.]